MDEYICCLLGICCPPFSEAQRATFVKVLASKVGKEKANAIATEHFDKFAAVTNLVAKAVSA